MTNALLPAPFKVLVDTPEDGAAEETCWVPVAFAPTEDQAIALAIAEGVIQYDDGRLELIVEDKVWMQRDPAYEKVADRASCWRNIAEDYELDYEPWIDGSQWAEGAIELWRLSVVEREDA